MFLTTVFELGSIQAQNWNQLIFQFVDSFFFLISLIDFSILNHPNSDWILGASACLPPGIELLMESFN